ncbi:MAG: Uma2 family endonuclease [Leptolyngbyaceae bacterium]|nr:Uma2 family endonuclease [Leptolyngbyaceae bacterium]
MELLSNSTAHVDRGAKKDIYQDIFRTPDYFWFDPDSLEFQGFHLIDGRYEPLQPNEQGWLWSQQLELHLGIHQQQLRFFTAKGELVPTPEEAAQEAAQQTHDAVQRAEAERQRAEAEHHRAEAECRRAEAERRRNEKLTAKLRELGIDPDNMSE